MKKILLTSILIVSFVFCAFASEPAVVTSSLIPLALYHADFESIDLTDPPYDSSLVALPFIVKDSTFEFQDLVSSNPIKIADAVLDFSMIYTAVEDLRMLDSSGTIDVIWDYERIEDGAISFSVIYDGVNLLYSACGVSESKSIDGRVDLTVLFKTPYLVELIVDSDTTLEKGQFRVMFSYDSDSADAYLSSMTDMENISDYSVEIMLSVIPSDVLESLFGSEIYEMNPSDIRKYLEDNQMKDILDFIIFFMVASDDSRLTLGDIFSLSISTYAEIDNSGEILNLDRFVKNVIKLIDLAEDYWHY